MTKRMTLKQLLVLMNKASRDPAVENLLAAGSLLHLGKDATASLIYLRSRRHAPNLEEKPDSTDQCEGED